MKTRLLIDKLSNELKPNHKAPSLSTITLISFTVSSIILAILVIVSGIRNDISQVFFSKQFLLENAFIILTIIFSLITAFVSSIPGRKNHIAFRTALPLLFVLWIGIFVYCCIASPIKASNSFVKNGITCVGKLIFFSIPPFIVLFFYLSRGAVLNRVKTGFFLSVSAAIFGILGLQFTCTSDYFLHLVAWHFVPAFFLSAFGILVTHYCFRKI